MKYKLLQLGDEVKAGDEKCAVFDSLKWVTVPNFMVESLITQREMDIGLIFRRPERRTEIEVMAGTEDELGLVIMLDEEREEICMSNEDWALNFPVSYAQKLIDAITELAGLDAGSDA